MFGYTNNFVVGYKRFLKEELYKSELEKWGCDYYKIQRINWEPQEIVGADTTWKNRNACFILNG